MKLRYRLFIWVAGVFCIAFTASFFLEDHITRVSLQHAYQDLLKELNKINEEKTKAIEEYLADMLYKIQAEVDAVLQGVSKYQLIRKGFVPSIENLKNSNWLDSASLLITNKWMDFIQSMNEESLMSQIIIDTNTLNDILLFPVEKEFSLIAVHDKDSKWNGPYIGINIDISSLHGEERSTMEREADEDYFAFFTPQALLEFDLNMDHPSLDLSINLLEPFLKWIEVPSKNYFLAEFLGRIDKAQKYLKAHPETLPSSNSWMEMIKYKSKDLNSSNPFDCYPIFQGSDGHSSEDQYFSKQVKHYVREFIEHYNKVGLIWGLSTLTHADLFGKTPLAPGAPVGLGMIDRESKCGKGLLSKNVFYNEPKYHVGKSLAKMETLSPEFLTTHLDIIAPSHMRHVFFGNTLKLEVEEEGQVRTGYLTVGMHGGSVLGSLARSVHRTTLFISENRVVSVVNAEGNEINDEIWFQIPTAEILQNTHGIVNVNGVDYYYLHIAPYKRLDLHFFTFTPKQEEFAMLNSMNAEAEKILKKITLQMRLGAIGGLVFVLFFLNNIAKRITRPISHLVEVTGTVAEGKLEEVKIPEENRPKRQDEISALYHSFFEMVKGLKEKERVRGVLNKVVSKEIAEEALKGNIQLGGEEKRVTVFFADIRHFTEMTEKMDPKEVIKLVNSCMTLVSNIIDQHGGVIDKYVGDEVMALFGAPIEKKESALEAIKCGIDIVESLKKWNREKEGHQIEMGIGIHTGTVVAGNMGAENRLNYTVLGANVNLASRLCSEAEAMEVLISEETLQEECVKANIEVEGKESVDLKGFTKPIPIYSVKSYKEHQ